MGNNYDVQLMEDWTRHVDATVSMSLRRKDPLRQQDRAEQEMIHPERSQPAECQVMSTEF